MEQDMSEAGFHLPPSRLRIVFLALLADTILLTLLMNWLGRPLFTPAAPYGIVSFELAGSPAAAQSILESWDAGARLRAAFIQGLDFLYLLVYAVTFALASWRTSGALQRLGWPLARLGKPVALGFGLAAACDVLENIALTLVLFGTQQSPLPETAAVCAAIKFGWLFIGLVYIFYGLAVFLASRLMPPAGKPAA
jgi:hypothetical protein